MGSEETKERQHLISISRSPFSFAINFECGTSYRLCWNSISSNKIHFGNGGSRYRINIFIFKIVALRICFSRPLVNSFTHNITDQFIYWLLHMIYWLLHWLIHISTTKIYTLKINKHITLEETLLMKYFILWVQ